MIPAECEITSTGSLHAPATLTSSSRLEMHASIDDFRLSKHRKTVSNASRHPPCHDHATQTLARSMIIREATAQHTAHLSKSTGAG
jgi:hypothetical protein